MECFIQQVFSGHLLFAKQEEYNQEPLSATLGKVLKNRMEQRLCHSGSHQTHTHSAVEPWTWSFHTAPPLLWPQPTSPHWMPVSASPLSPLSLLLFLSLLLCLIKKHLLAIHCLSEQNLYFRHVEPWILNLNINVGRIPRLLHPILFVSNHTL